MFDVISFEFGLLVGVIAGAICAWIGLVWRRYELRRRDVDTDICFHRGVCDGKPKHKYPVPNGYSEWR